MNDGSRTHTPLRALAPQASASAIPPHSHIQLFAAATGFEPAGGLSTTSILAKLRHKPLGHTAMELAAPENPVICSGNPKKAFLKFRDGLGFLPAVRNVILYAFYCVEDCCSCYMILVHCYLSVLPERFELPTFASVVRRSIR